MKFKVNDNVIVTAGKDKGKKGQITKIFPTKNRVIIKGVNTYKRHLKRQSDKNPGGIVQLERPLPVGNLALICPSCNQPTRIGYQLTKSTKIRLCKKCQAPIKAK